MSWQEPPVRKRGPGRPPSETMVTAVAELRGSPGEWKLIKEYKNLAAASKYRSIINTGANLLWAPAGTFEATTRNTKLYARYVGE